MPPTKEACKKEQHASLADTAAQLVERREPEAVRVVDDDRVRVRQVEPVLDDRRRDQHLYMR